MKKLEFETSKGRFLVVDAINNANIHTGTKISEITEEQSSEIVDEDNEYGIRIFQNYQTTSMQYFDEQLSATESLRSLLRSKGIHLFKNPLQSSKPTADLSFYDNVKDVKLIYNKWKEAEEKTFYNPYIFKLWKH